MTATDMPEAIRENRSRLETGHAPTADSVFGPWEDQVRAASPGFARRIEEVWPGVQLDGLGAAATPEAIVSLIGQHTGLERDEVDIRLTELFTDRSN